METLIQETAKAGKVLVERLAIYPAYVRHADVWLDRALRSAVTRASDSEGFARADPWMPGTLNKTHRGAARSLLIHTELDAIIARALAGQHVVRR